MSESSLDRLAANNPKVEAALAAGERTVVLWATGEVVSLDAPTDILAEAIDHLRDSKGELQDASRMIQNELLRRMDEEARWTHRAGPWKVSAPSPAPKVEYDAKALHDRLMQLVAEGVISAGAVNSAVDVVVVFKPKVSGINALVKLGKPQVTNAIAMCSLTTQPNRNVSVTRA